MIFYGPKEDPGVKELGQKSPEPTTRVQGAPIPREGAPPSTLTRGPLDVKPTPKIPINTETPERNLDQEFRRHKSL